MGVDKVVSMVMGSLSDSNSVDDDIAVDVLEIHVMQMLMVVEVLVHQ